MTCLINTRKGEKEYTFDFTPKCVPPMVNKTNKSTVKC